MTGATVRPPIAGEMGFPSVVGTVDATKRIANGMVVRVDGDAGTVTILSAEATV